MSVSISAFGSGWYVGLWLVDFAIWLIINAVLCALLWICFSLRSFVEDVGIIAAAICACS